MNSPENYGNFDSRSQDEMIRDVQETLKQTNAIGNTITPYTLILGAGFSYPVVPTSRDIVLEQLPKWLASKRGNKDIVAFTTEFWDRVRHAVQKERRKKNESFELNEDGIPHTETTDQVSTAYSAAMRHGLGGPNERRDFLPSHPTSWRPPK